MAVESKFFSIDARLGGEHRPEVYLSALYPEGDNADIVAFDEERLHKEYASVYRLKPFRLARTDEKIVARASVDYQKGKWCDILYIAHSNPMGNGVLCVSRRVYDALKSEGIQAYRAFYVEPEGKKPGSGLPKDKQMPEYVALLPDPGIEIETEYIDVTPKRDPRLTRSNRKVKRFVPIENSWEGFDLFRVNNNKTCCCTRRIVELARQHQWTNFEFKPLDVRRDMPTEGINYLAEQWPPESWYPRPPSEGKTVEEWVDAYMKRARNEIEQARNPESGKNNSRLSTKAKGKTWWKERQRPRNAIVSDLATESVPIFVDILRHGDELDRHIAAHMLSSLASHTRIDLAVLEQEVLPVFVRRLQQSGRKAPAQSIIVLSSYIEIDPEILDLAHKTTGKPPLQPPHNRDEPLTEEDRDAIDKCTRAGLAWLQIDSQAAHPDTVVKKIAEAIEAYRHERPKLAPEMFQELWFQLGALWGEQICKVAGWEWRRVWTQQAQDALAVVSLKRHYAVYPHANVRDLLESNERQPSDSIALYESIKTGRGLPPMTEGIYHPLW